MKSIYDRNQDVNHCLIKKNKLQKNLSKDIIKILLKSGLSSLF